MPETTLHVLIDNQSADPALDFEHGWSVWLDRGSDDSWLWDTGQTGLLLQNAAAMGIDPLTAKGVALSHGHYDHAGGLPTLLDKGFSGVVVGHPNIAATRYSRRGETTYRSVGMGDSRLAGSLPGFQPAKDIAELGQGLTFVTGISRQPGFFTATANLFTDTAGQEPDGIEDDACLLLDGANGPLVLLGCCHSGLANTLWHVRQRLGIETIATVVGGLHLRGAPDAALEETLEALRAFGVKRLFTGHCTGDAATAYLVSHYWGQTTATGCGMVIYP
jgi:7,8-dihydropterin-6-yl-methyl-4-(beta-D-ribofuranosyl)aminobenzene 5'-phosphate synthase